MPTKRIEFHEEASAEYDAAFDWYLERSLDAASNFDAEVNRALADITSAPQPWAEGPHSTRRYLLASLTCWFIAIEKSIYKS
ncbi:MAG TPA: type II toxin-antitoxin system RelE/ParE family toxin [Candidatus Sulfotelmatobacter sp.]|nr:type II toxin-antitoxin system RelE/ParE family toxin [Candidatus Sulfotelmatobacter sp.]